MSQWAERYRVVSPEASARPGPWRNALVPYGVEIMDTISGSEYEDITVIAPSQSAKTELCLLNPLGFFIDNEPSSILVIQPNVKPMAESFSKQRLAPMIRDCERLRTKVKDARSRDSGNTIQEKAYPGGFIAIVGANSPAGLASRPIRIVLADELDRWEGSAGTEGDPLALAEARTKTYGHRKKIVKVTSPGNEGESRAEKAWKESDQRHYHVPCPHCGEYQPLEWRDTGGKPDIKAGRGDYRLVWDKVEVDGKVEHRPETAVYVCRKCGVAIEETHKAAMIAAGCWVKHKPESPKAGFAISAFTLPWVRWKDIAQKWLEKKDDPEQRKTFFNTDLGLLYVQEGEQPDTNALTSRREEWEDVPRPVGALTMGIDVQGDRLEVLIMGWGAEEESWLVHFERLYGDPEQAEVWARAEAVLNREWKHAGGAKIQISTCAIDSGYLADTVYRFVQPRQLRGVFALKGSDELKVPLSRAHRNNRDRVKAFTFNPNIFKDSLFARLRRVTPGAGYIHIGTEAKTSITEEFLNQFGAEKRTVDYKKGRPKVSYILLSGRRNEAIDLYNMNLAAIRSLGATFVQQLGEHAEAIQEEGKKLKQSEEQKDTKVPAPADEPPEEPAEISQNWVHNWR